MKNRDVLLVSLSDMHSGGSTALFPDYQMVFNHANQPALPINPNPKQSAMYKHWVHCAQEVKRIGKGKRLIIVHNGDAIDGFHHGTIQLMVSNEAHQSQIHIALMDDFLKACGFSRKNGDEIHYTSGTESHTNWAEYGISQHFQDAQYHDELKMTVNGREVWYTHHGANAGKGANEGNGHRNWLRDIYYDCLKWGTPPPDMVITSHFHKASYQAFIDGYRHTLHGQILPSWQFKTRYAHRVVPFQRNDIGLTLTEVTAGGHIRIIPPLLMEA